MSEATKSGSNSGPWILAAAIIGSSMAFIDGTVVNVAAPKFQTAFHATVIDVQWVIESYGILLSSLILVGGALGDRLGRRFTFLSGVGLFASASAACGLAPTVHVLIVARSIQGIGAALLVPGSLAIISASFDQNSRGRAIGTWAGATAITAALGPVLGGMLIDYASWRWAFFLNLPLAFAVIVISLRHVPETSSQQKGPLDWLGALLATASLGGLVTGLLEASTLGWRNVLVEAGLLGGALFFILFSWVERRAASPMVPLSIFKSRAFLGANLLTLFLYAALGIFFFLFPLTLMQVYRYSATAAGAASLPVILLLFSLSRWSGGLVSRYGGDIPLIVGPLVSAAGFVLFALLTGSGSYWRTFFPATLILGLGMAITVAPLTTVVMESADQNDAGSASGINNAISRLAGVLAIAVFGILMVNTFSSRLDRTLASLSLPVQVVQEIQAEKTQLAAMELPKNLQANAVLLLRKAISDSFLAGFRQVLFCCAGLAVASSIFAWRLLSRE